MSGLTPSLFGRDLLTLAAWTREEIAGVLDLAAAIKAEPASYRSALAGRVGVLLFEKPSLRTRVSFEVGFARLGGHAVYLEHIHSLIGEREAIRDYAKNLERWSDVVIARVFEHGTLEELAEYSSKPVVNALSELSHPCQALADMLTLRERLGTLEGKTLAYVGDGNNVCHSLMLASSIMGVHLVVVTPPGYEPTPEMARVSGERAGASGASLRITNDIGALAGSDAVYTDAWVSMGQADEAGKRLEAFRAYQVNNALMATAGPDTLFMHCLPAKRGVEVTDSVIDSARSVVYDQAENRMHAQNALLLNLLGESD